MSISAFCILHSALAIVNFDEFITSCLLPPAYCLLPTAFSSLTMIFP